MNIKQYFVPSAVLIAALAAFVPVSHSQEHKNESVITVTSTSFRSASSEARQAAARSGLIVVGQRTTVVNDKEGKKFYISIVRVKPKD